MPIVTKRNSTHGPSPNRATITESPTGSHPWPPSPPTPQIDGATELAATEDDGCGYENWDDDQALEAYPLECAFGPDF